MHAWPVTRSIFDAHAPVARREGNEQTTGWITAHPSQNSDVTVARARAAQATGFRLCLPDVAWPAWASGHFAEGKTPQHILVAT